MALRPSYRYSVQCFLLWHLRVRTTHTNEHSQHSEHSCNTKCLRLLLPAASSLRSNKPQAGAGLLQIVGGAEPCRVGPASCWSPGSRGHQMTSPVSIATEPNDAHPKLRPHYRRQVPRFAVPRHSCAQFSFRITIKIRISHVKTTGMISGV
jgi:hypothetical protein